MSTTSGKSAGCWFVRLVPAAVPRLDSLWRRSGAAPAAPAAGRRRVAEHVELIGLPAGIECGGVSGGVSRVRVVQGSLGVGEELRGLGLGGVDECLPFGDPRIGALAGRRRRGRAPLCRTTGSQGTGLASADGPIIRPLQVS